MGFPSAGFQDASIIPPSTTTSSRVAVIGGGISGLAAAHRLLELASQASRALQVTLYESGPRPGGVVGTREIAGYRVETGADSFITNKPWALDLCRRLGLEHALIPTDAAFRRSLVLRNGIPLEVPEGFQLLAPVKVSAVLRSPIFSPWGKLRMGLEYFLPRGAPVPDESLASFVRRRFGREALERLVQPLVGGIYTSDPEQLSLRATLPRFLEMERQHGSLIRALKKQSAAADEHHAQASGARYGLFLTLERGISQLLNTLAEKVAQVATIRTATTVRRVLPDPAGQRFSLELADGTREEFDAVISAVPAFAAADLVDNWAHAAAESLRRIEYASTAIVVSGHKLADVRHPLDAFGLVVPAVENRRILAVSFTSRKFPNRAPDGCVQLRTFVGGAMQPELMQLSDEELTRLVREELESLLGVTWRPDFSLVARWNRAMPQYHVGHLDLVAAIQRNLAAAPRFALAGNALHGVGLPDCIHSAELAAEQIASRLAE